MPLENLCYYWFVGANTIVGTHEQRVWVDALDRVMHGYNQRWAMVLVAGEITGMLDPRGRSEEQTDAALQEVIRQIVPGHGDGERASRLARSGRLREIPPDRAQKSGIFAHHDSVSRCLP